MNRIVNVVRLQLVNRAAYVWVPLLVLVASFVLSLFIYALIPVDAPKYSGGAQAALWTFLAMGVVALTQTFPFSMALGIARREFFLGSLLAAAGTAACTAVVFALGGVVETATDGWGINGWYFALPWLRDTGALGIGLFYFVVALLFFSIGFWFATIYKRFGLLVLVSVFVALGTVLVAAMAIIGRLNAWADVFGWFASLTPLGLVWWLLVLTAVLAGASFWTLRRATA
ncbi:hypothetical protein GCM10009785_18820 [Brooklawnia cerclae]|uniref:ABC transporter permease n=1 Tax=Brooklawnia cerclae TaxID=349934 RepID=A0ABX0SGN1_9ACTN|nr:hypothetical protein [Brooklawnia cerclae]NIH57545.1 hypothetical protein [Brooklawnia cerclae]